VELSDYYEHQKKHTNTLCEQNEEVLRSKPESIYIYTKALHARDGVGFKIEVMEPSLGNF
jgi:hypothetical protein